MSKYTREQIKAALRDVDEATATCGGEHVGDVDDHRVDALAAALGLSVEDPRPEPGVYVNQFGMPVILIGEDFKEGRAYHTAMANSVWVAEQRTNFAPARVVPEAEYQRLVEEADMSTEAPVRTSSDESKIRAWDRIVQHPVFSDRFDGEGSMVDRMVATLDGVSITPSRAAVRDAVADNRGNGWGLNDDAINAITDSVMALLQENTR